LIVIDQMGSIYQNRDIDPKYFPDFLDSLNAIKQRENMSLLVVTGSFPTSDGANNYMFIKKDDGFKRRTSRLDLKDIEVLKLKQAELGAEQYKGISSVYIYQ
jgi:hypothetical protein